MAMMTGAEMPTKRKALRLVQGDLFQRDGWAKPCAVSLLLEESHYLGATNRGFAWIDEFGAIVFAAPTSRRIPHTWIELTRWCLNGTKNGGSKQWRKVAFELLRKTNSTTVVSYSDPSAGHTGALYRACNWSWAPTWHRIKPPPTGNGRWKQGTLQSVKDRWVFELRPDSERAEVLKLSKHYDGPGYGYREPKWKRGKRTPYVEGFRLFCERGPA